MAPGSQSHLSDPVVNSTEMHTHRSSVETTVFLGHVGKECLKSSVDHEGKEAQPSKGVGQKPEQRPCKRSSEVHVTASFHAASSLAHTNSLRELSPAILRFRTATILYATLLGKRLSLRKDTTSLEASLVYRLVRVPQSTWHKSASSICQSHQPGEALSWEHGSLSLLLPSPPRGDKQSSGDEQPAFHDHFSSS